MKSLIALTLLSLATQSWAGPNNVSLNIQRAMVTSVSELQSEKQLADDIIKAYFSTSASSLVSAAASNATAVTVGSKLTKIKFINGITMAQQVQNLFTNQAVTQGDYLATIHNLLNGSDAATEALSQDVEVIGTHLVELAMKLLATSKSCRSTLASYNSSELSAALVNVSLTSVVFGADVTKQVFVDGMNLCQQVQNLVDNVAVTQGDWASVASKWNQGL